VVLLAGGLSWWVVSLAGGLAGWWSEMVGGLAGWWSVCGERQRLSQQRLLTHANVFKRLIIILATTTTPLEQASTHKSANTHTGSFCAS